MTELKYIVSKLKQAKDSRIELEEEEMIRRTSGVLNIITFMIHGILSGLLGYKSLLSMSVSKVTSELCLTRRPSFLMHSSRQYALKLHGGSKHA